MVYFKNFKNPCKKHVIPPGFVGGCATKPGIDMPGYKDVNPPGFLSTQTRCFFETYRVFSFRLTLWVLVELYRFVEFFQVTQGN